MKNIGNTTLFLNDTELTALVPAYKQKDSKPLKEICS